MPLLVLLVCIGLKERTVYIDRLSFGVDDDDDRDGDGDDAVGDCDDDWPLVLVDTYASL